MFPLSFSASLWLLYAETHPLFCWKWGETARLPSSNCLFGLLWELQGKGGSGVIAGNADGAAMLRNNAVDQGQSQSGTLRLCSEEWNEDSGKLVVWNAAAVVTNAE